MTFHRALLAGMQFAGESTFFFFSVHTTTTQWCEPVTLEMKHFALPCGGDVEGLMEKPPNTVPPHLVWMDPEVLVLLLWSFILDLAYKKFVVQINYKGAGGRRHGMIICKETAIAITCNVSPFSHSISAASDHLLFHVWQLSVALHSLNIMFGLSWYQGPHLRPPCIK